MFGIKSNLIYEFIIIIGTEEEAAEAYDIAAIKFRGLNAVTNFDMNRYDVKAILESNTLPIGGGAAKRLKEAQALETSRRREEMIALGSAFQYGSSSSSSRQQQQQLQVAAAAYPIMQAQPYEQPPLLTLQNQDISPYNTTTTGQDPLQANYFQTQLQLQQTSYNNAHFYNGYVHQSSNNPQTSLFHGLVNMESGGGYLGNNSGIGGSSGSGEQHHELGLVKVDYDMPSSGGYGNWSGGDHGVNGFSMWND